MKLSLKQKIINFIGIFVIFFFQMLDNVMREINIESSNVSMMKNMILVAATILFLYEIYLLNINRSEILFWEELFDVIKLTMIFFFLSLYFAWKNGGFEFITIEYLFRLLLPVVVGFAVINVMNIGDIYKLMSVMLVIMFAGYMFFVLGVKGVHIEEVTKISFVDSYSPFESNFFSPVAVGFCLFFCYYRKYKIFTILSVLFTIMTFKRIMIIYAVFLLLFGTIFITNKKVPKLILIMYKICFFILSVIYIKLMLGNINDFIFEWFGIDANKFSMGRAWLMQYIYGNFTSHGFGTSTIRFRSMEMDIPQIYIEMGIISVIATIHYITNLAKQNWYNFIIIIFCMLELLTSHWFDITYFWIVMYITIGSIQYKDNCLYKKGKKLKFVVENKKVGGRYEKNFNYK